MLTWQLNTLSLSFRRRPGTCEALALSSAITGCRIKPGLTDYTYLVAGLIPVISTRKNPVLEDEALDCPGKGLPKNIKCDVTKVKESLQASPSATTRQGAQLVLSDWQNTLTLDHFKL